MIILWILGIFALLIIITVLINIFRNWNKLINYKNLFTSLITTIIMVSILLYFIEANLIIVSICYLGVLIFSLFYGAFKKPKNNTIPKDK